MREAIAHLARETRRFDVIFVASLFSHLPERRFVPWLRWLYRRLAPGGVLVVSTHGPESLLPGRALPAGGFHFETLSESRRLTGDEYGSTWVSASASSGTFRIVSFPRSIAGLRCSRYRRCTRGLGYPCSKRWPVALPYSPRTAPRFRRSSEGLGYW